MVQQLVVRAESFTRIPTHRGPFCAQNLRKAEKVEEILCDPAHPSLIVPSFSHLISTHLCWTALDWTDD
jgi:hypothetical protein